MQTELIKKNDQDAQTIANEVTSIEVQTDLTTQDEKESRMNLNEMQLTEVQTERNFVEDQWLQTENIGKVDSESQVELTNQNIMTVDKIEVVEGMETFPTQTDQDELNEMSLFKCNVDSNPLEKHKLSTSGDKDSNSEVESTFSSVSKSDERNPVTVSAGLDMRVAKYKELSFPPVSTLPKKPSTLQAPKTERTPSPMDLCMKEIPEEDKKKCNKKRKPTGTSVSATPYNYYQPAKSKQLDDIRITPAHQGDVNLSPTTNVHLSPIGFMSASMAIVQRLSISIINQSSVTDLSVKHASIKSGETSILPPKFTPVKSSGWESFRELSLQPQLTVNKMLKFRSQILE